MIILLLFGCVLLAACNLVLCLDMDPKYICLLILWIGHTSLALISSAFCLCIIVTFYKITHLSVGKMLTLSFIFVLIVWIHFIVYWIFYFSKVTWNESTCLTVDWYWLTSLLIIESLSLCLSTSICIYRLLNSKDFKEDCFPLAVNIILLMLLCTLLSIQLQSIPMKIFRGLGLFFIPLLLLVSYFIHSFYGTLKSEDLVIILEEQIIDTDTSVDSEYSPQVKDIKDIISSGNINVLGEVHVAHDTVENINISCQADIASSNS